MRKLILLTAEEKQHIQRLINTLHSVSVIIVYRFHIIVISYY